MEGIPGLHFASVGRYFDIFFFSSQKPENAVRLTDEVIFRFVFLFFILYFLFYLFSRFLKSCFCVFLSQITTTQHRASPGDGSMGTTDPGYGGVGMGPGPRLGFVRKVSKKR